MSNYPSTPSFGGPFAYAQQWPPSNPSPSNSMPSMLPQDFSSHGEYTAPGTNNDMGNFHANSNIPGLGGFGTTGPLPPPPFPFIGLPPPPFPPFQIPPVMFPPMPLQADLQQDGSSMNNAQAYASNGTIQALNSQAATGPGSREDSDREEGEVSDMEGQRTSQSKKAASERQKFGSQSKRADAPDGRNDSAVNKGSSKKARCTKDSKRPILTSQGATGKSNFDLEEGEASPLGPRASVRDSGSPYNPPVSVTAVPDPVESTACNSSKPPDVYRKSPSSSTPKESQSQTSAKKSPSQLRVQAQGALLSLAPHNIRYNELVGEGINPTILKQLYEEVGIKVTTPQSDTADYAAAQSAVSVSSEDRPSMNTDPPTVSPTEPLKAQPDPAGPAQIPEAGTAANKTVTVPKPPSVLAPPPSSQSDVGKPLERKEVIARMLAAKAAKASGASQPPKPDVEIEKPATSAPPSTDTEKSASVTPSTEAIQNDKETRVREKNKAQTELARQRIELLKKQGLMRGQQKPQSGAVSQNTLHRGNEIAQVPSPSNSASPAIRHPLPNRPPVPDSALPARIPGLFMTEQSPSEESAIKPDQGQVIDSNSQTRATHRKRPRASDFDEPVVTSRTSFGQAAHNGVPEDRLIIDISDDEVFYGDGETDAMDIDSSADQILEDARSKVLTGAKMPRLERYPSSTELAARKYTTSQTPSRGNDLEDLRQKDLEIQAMRRRIAEMEERKKVKLTAGRTELAGALSPSDSPEVGNPTARDVGLVENAASVITLKAQTGNVNRDIDLGGSFSTQRLTFVGVEELKSMRSKLLRKKEIESGLPALDAAILKSEARLAEFKEEEGRLLAEIAKGKQGRQQLVEELEHLGTETNGISLEELQEAQHQLEKKEQQQVLDKARTVPPSVSAGDDISVPDTPAAETDDAEPPRSASPGLTSEARPLPESGSALEATAATADIQSSLPAHETGDSGKEPPPPSLSESGGSAMDESIDSALPDSVEQPALEESAATNTNTPDEYEATKLADLRETISITSDNHHDSLPERPRFIIPMDAHPDSDISVGKVDNRASREPSVASEAYEPPEPETSADSGDEAYTPPFSPASGPAEPSDVSAPSIDQPQTDKPLTGKVQPFDSDAQHVREVGHLDQAPQEEILKPRFSPYLSPLGYFKAYRYHPDFVDNVSGGYRSLTYSHAIDPMKYVCPFEAAGGVCNDRSCEFQHFRDMTLSDDKILVQMGSLREGKTQEEKDNYLAGLKQIINDMRRDQVKDFNTVATEIAAYRRRFLQDPSRILPL